MRLWRRFPFHLIALVSYPILALAAANTGQLRISAIWRPLAVSLGLAFILWLALSWIMKDQLKAGLIVSLAAILFFSYGHVYELAQRAGWVSGQLGRHRVLIPLWGLLLVLAVFLIRRLRRTVEVNQVLNVVGLALFLMPLVQLGSYAGRISRAQQSQSSMQFDPASGEAIHVELPENPPDVYYIILDAYSRSDVLRESWDIDNHEFLQQLEAMGFQIADCSQSNYGQTELAFASALNMAYLDDLGDQFKANRDDRAPLRPLIKHSLVRRLLEQMGYHTVAFETGFPFSEIDDADLYIAPRFPGLAGGLSGFEALLLRSSAGLILLDAAQVLPQFLVPSVDHTVTEHRQRTLLTLSTLEDPAQFESPAFVLAHIVSPHTPFVFGPGGSSEVSPTFDGEGQARQQWYQQGYAGQIKYLNDRMIAILQGILASSETKPIIILQGDHGPEEGSSQDRMRILNAYYLPGYAEAIPVDISPVNSFRTVFNLEFGTDLPLLANTSFFSTYNRPYDYNIIDNSGCQAD